MFSRCRLRHHTDIIRTQGDCLTIFLNYSVGSCPAATYVQSKHGTCRILAQNRRHECWESALKPNNAAPIARVLPVMGQAPDYRYGWRVSRCLAITVREIDDEIGPVPPRKDANEFREPAWRACEDRPSYQCPTDKTPQHLPPIHGGGADIQVGRNDLRRGTSVDGRSTRANGCTISRTGKERRNC